ncbi:MAG: amidohydrolase family protein [Myxococcales bacterium]|nr:amidohydrolase family protein [Myxococcales bacterium]
MQWDTLIKGALVFDGTGEEPSERDVAIKDGEIAEVGHDLSGQEATETVEAKGRWLLPGLWDIHTHLDLEVELDPGLTEVVRHGTTSAVVANCSIGVPFGRQNESGHDPVVSCFARVENIPKGVLRRVADNITWNNPKAYLEHFAEIPLGANIVPMIPHSMLRIEAMGIDRAISNKPTPEELDKMEQILEQAMEDGYAGFSTDSLPFHYLSNDPYRKTRIPANHSTYAEVKRLTNVARRHGRVWQATPDKDNPLKVIRTFALTSGRLFGRPLKLTAVAALDVVTNRFLAKLGVVLTRVLNSKLLDGRFRLQALAAPFRVYADGPITPLSEEIPALRELNEIDLDDKAARMALLDDPEYRKRFRKMWYHDKKGLSLGRIKRWLRMMDDSLSRDLEDMVMTARPLPVWEGETLEMIYHRLLAWQVSGEGARDDAEAGVFESFPNPVGDDCDFFLHLLRHFDMQLRWYVLAANDDEDRLARVLFDRQMLPGFNDSGAHLTNMAYYDGNLRGLQIAQRRSLKDVAYHVGRLTRAPAEFWGISSVGTLEPGKQADVILVDPDALRAYDSEAQTIFEYREAVGSEQMLNRSDGVVTDVWIAGVPAWRDSRATPHLGKTRMGRALTVTC